MPQWKQTWTRSWALALALTAGVARAQDEAAPTDVGPRALVSLQSQTGGWGVLGGGVELALSERVTLELPLVARTQWSRTVRRATTTLQGFAAQQEQTNTAFGASLEPGVNVYLGARALEGLWVGVAGLAGVERVRLETTVDGTPEQQWPDFVFSNLHLGGTARVGFTKVFGGGFSLRADAGLQLVRSVELERPTFPGDTTPPMDVVNWGLAPVTRVAVGWAF